MTTPDSTGGDQQGQGSGAGTAPDSTAQGQGQQGSGTGTAPDTSQADSWSADEWRAFAQEVGLTPAELRQRLGHAREWEKRAKDNREGAQRAQTLQQQLEQVQRDLAERDLKDLQRATRQATTELRAELIGLGLSEADAVAAALASDRARMISGQNLGVDGGW